jgi:hypothetical protein
MIDRVREGNLELKIQKSKPVQFQVSGEEPSPYISPCFETLYSGPLTFVHNPYQISTVTDVQVRVHSVLSTPTLSDPLSIDSKVVIQPSQIRIMSSNVWTETA